MELSPGIYDDLPFSDYLAINAVSNTAMGALARSPLHYKNARPLEQQKHLVLGNLVHCGRLEPGKFAQRYAVEPNYHLDKENVTTNGEPTNHKATNYVKQKRQEFASQCDQDGLEVVPHEWYAEACSTVHSLWQDNYASALLNTAGPFELTLVWDDPETGIRCKGRMDKLCSSQGKFADLKTTTDILKFPKAFLDYNYARQMAHYRSGYAVLTGEVLDAWIIAVEKSQPYCVQSARVSDEALDWGEAEQQRLLRKLAYCRQTDTWPGPERPKEWTLPEWKLNQGESVSLTIGGKAVEV